MDKREDGRLGPAEPDAVRDRLQGRAQELAASGVVVSAGERGATVGALERLFPHTANKIVRGALRHRLCVFIFAEGSTKKLTDPQIRTLNFWAQERLSTGGYVPRTDAVQEAAKIIRLVDLREGQKRLFDEEEQ